MRRLKGLAAAVLVVSLPLLAHGAGVGNIARAQEQSQLTATPFVYDPGHTNIIVSQWIKNLGLPPTQGRAGLLLSKNGPTATNASAGATIHGVRGITLTELGFDRRGFLPTFGGHCGAGAPRYNVVTDDNVDHFFGCVYGTHTPDSPAPGWERIRFTPLQSFPPMTPTEKVKSIDVVFDEGTDASGAPDKSGLVVLTNLDINGQIAQPSTGNGGDGGGDGGDGSDGSNGGSNGNGG